MSTTVTEADREKAQEWLAGPLSEGAEAIVERAASAISEAREEAKRCQHCGGTDAVCSKGQEEAQEGWMQAQRDAVSRAEQAEARAREAEAERDALLAIAKPLEFKLAQTTNDAHATSRDYIAALERVMTKDEATRIVMAAARRAVDPATGIVETARARIELRKALAAYDRASEEGAPKKVRHSPYCDLERYGTECDCAAKESR